MSVAACAKCVAMTQPRRTTTDRLNAAIEAEAAVLAGQSVQWEGQQITRANLGELSAHIRRLERQEAREQNRRSGFAAVASFNGRR